MSDLICIFDVGTTGTRTIIFDINGKEIAKAYEEYQIPEQPVGISEQNPQVWWAAIKNTCNKVMKSQKFNPDDIIGISGAFARGTVTIVDNNGEILHPALTWLDERELTDAKGFKDELIWRNSLPKLLWLKANKTDLFNKASKIIWPDSYTYLKLCDKFVTDPTNGINGILNIETWQWDENLAEAYELPISLWPELHMPGEIIGELAHNAANDLGLKPNIPIVLGGGDQQCAALGMGVIEKGQSKVTTGTGTMVDYVIDEPKRVVGDIPIFTIPHLIKGKWILEGVMPGTGTMFQTYAKNFSQLLIKECEEKNLNVYDMLTKEAEKAPPGSNGLLFIPLYIFRKGTIHGLGWHHSRPHFARAIMESAALSAQMYLTLIEGFGGIRSDVLKSDGGAMNSSFWAQIFADVINKKIMIPENKDGAAVGAAILGFYGCKKFTTIKDGIEQIVRFSEEKVPNKETAKIYKKLTRIFFSTVLETNDKKRVTKDL
ncbi:MAG: FGGY-family carbohydrate kinase [Candidatus Hermodarchaeota archaeon]